MKDNRLYIVSFGDSDRYGILFHGSREEFEKSTEFRHIKDAVFGSVKEKFPGFDCERLIAPQVREASKNDDLYTELNADTLGKLKHDVIRQAEVILQNKELNSDAPYADIK